MPLNYCGSLLLRIGVGKPKEWKALDKQKTRWTLAPVRTRPYQLRLHLFRGRNLPVADENGFSDPFAKIKYCGKTEEGPIIRKTLNPNWYTTIFLNFEGPVLGTGTFLSLSIYLSIFILSPAHPHTGYVLKKLLPPVFISIQDHDRLVCDDLGTCFHNLSSENVVANDKILGFRDKVPDPTWHQLSLGGKASGEILISSQICPLLDRNEVLTRPPASFLEPKTMKVLLEVFVLGLREMKGRFGGRPTKPFLRFCVGEKTLRTAPSGKPNRRNPNYLIRIQEVVELPVEQIYMPTLRMEAVDSLLGGRIEQIIAAHELPLENKTDWTQSRAGWVQQYFEDKAFELMDPKKGERLDSVKINQRINRVGLYFNDFLDALAKYVFLFEGVFFFSLLLSASLINTHTYTHDSQIRG